MRVICLQDPEAEGIAWGDPLAELTQIFQEFGSAAGGSGAPSQPIKSFMF